MRRPPTRDDWANATKLADTMDEVGVYWRMVTSGLDGEGGPGSAVAHWRDTFGLFGQPGQDEIATEEDAAWLLELLATIFGSREAVRRDHPFAVLFCPVSPLAMEAEHTDAWLATAGFAAMEPRSGRWAGGGPEQMVIDVEVYRMCRRLHEGIGAGVGETDVLGALDEVGPMGDFLARTQTRDAVRGGEWFVPRIAHHATFDRWEAAGRPDVAGQAREAAMTAIAGHQAVPFPDEVAAALERL